MQRRNVVEEEEGDEGSKRRDNGKQGREGLKRGHKRKDEDQRGIIGEKTESS